MRIYARRLFLLLCGAFVTALVLLNLPQEGKDVHGSGPLPRPSLRKPRQKSASEEKIGSTPPPQEAIGPHGPVDQLKFGAAAVVANRRIDADLIEKLRAYLSAIDAKLVDAKDCEHNETLADYFKRRRRRPPLSRDSWERFYANIGTCDLYRDERLLQELMNDMAKMPIKFVETMEGGTQVKLVITFENEKQAVFKPMRFGRQYETDPNHFYFGDFERHTAEIATFHMDKILGFRRAVPTVGRIMNITTDLYNNAEKKLKKTFFVSPAKNLCFVSKCDYYCDTTHAICGSPDLKEGSLQMFLPDEEVVPRVHNRSPYRRTYSKRNQLAIWQQDMQFCASKVKTKRAYAHGRRLLDLIDLHIMDFLIGNQDRHHFETFSVFEEYEAYPVHLDNGRAFGKTKFDDTDILLPLAQCCVIRPSTLRTLLGYYSGPVSLSETLYRSMSADPAAPILANKHYPALERRLETTLRTVLKCLSDAGSAESVIRTSFENPDGVEEETKSEEENTAADDGKKKE